MLQTQSWLNSHEWMNTLWEGNRLQTAPPASRGWVYQYTVWETVGKKESQSQNALPSILLRECVIYWSELLIQQTLPSFLSPNPHSSCNVTWQNETGKTVSKAKAKVSSVAKCSSKRAVWHEGTIRAQNTLDKLSVGSCCSPLYRHWPMGGTAQMQRAGAVGGRLNWSSTVLDRAGSITVISLLKAGPETTQAEHWQKRVDMELGKMSGMKQRFPGKC